MRVGIQHTGVIPTIKSIEYYIVEIVTHHLLIGGWVEQFLLNADILSDLGFLTHVWSCLQLRGRPSASLWAPPCSTWVPINLGTSWRSAGRPLGNQLLKKIRDANRITSRMVLLLRLLDALGVCFVVEQPRGSLMAHHPRFRQLVKKVAIYKKSLKMKDFRV